MSGNDFSLELYFDRKHWSRRKHNSRKFVSWRRCKSPKTFVFPIFQYNVTYLICRLSVPDVWVQFSDFQNPDVLHFRFITCRQLAERFQFVRAFRHDTLTFSFIASNRFSLFYCGGFPRVQPKSIIGRQFLRFTWLHYSVLLCHYDNRHTLNSVGRHG